MYHNGIFENDSNIDFHYNLIVVLAADYFIAN